MVTQVRDAANYYRNSLKGIPLPLVERLVVEATREFCRVARPWKLWLGPYDLVADADAYPLITLPAQSVIDDIIRARILEYDIFPVSEAATFSGIAANIAWPFSTQLPEISYNREAGGSIVLSPPPDTALTDGLTVQVNLMPTPTADCFPDIIWNEHFECIQDWVNWRAMAQPNVAWSDAGIAAFHKDRYEVAVNLARDRVRSGNMTTRYRTVGNPWG